MSEVKPLLDDIEELIDRKIAELRMGDARIGEETSRVMGDTWRRIVKEEIADLCAFMAMHPQNTGEPTARAAWEAAEDRVRRGL